LQRGMSHRQAVIVLYGVSAIFALLSLFLLWPTGSTLGLVLAVLGTGIWIGVQHLGYLELDELQRVAVRTIEQPQIFVNNLAIRRAAENLKTAADFQELCRILNTAFENNDFDGFELRAGFSVAVEGLAVVQPAVCPRLRWMKPGSHVVPGFGNTWNLHLDLVSADNHYCGALVIFRLYTKRDLQVDINLFTSAFVTNLADALRRTAKSNIDYLVVNEDSDLLPARAG